MEIPIELQKIIDPAKECCCVYHFSNKCKEWANKKGFRLMSCQDEVGYCGVTQNKNYSPLLYSELCDTEPEAIFKATQWVWEYK